MRESGEKDETGQWKISGRKLKLKKSKWLWNIWIFILKIEKRNIIFETYFKNYSY